ncbi:MAG TPA: tyrosine-type recombinase/integrase [Streptosporangiaceae bacterium]|nr:tyrosine-type recombinase/integrase [Streptosporangiaceae bacterium]
MSDPALLPAGPARQVERPGEPGWLEWLQARLDPRWRAGEWDSRLLLFTGDLASPRTAAWACRTPGCVTATRRTSGRCDGCRRARVGAGLSWAEFDAAPPPRVTRPLRPGRCTVPGCESDLLCSGLCFRHERSWRHDTSEPLETFMTRARPLSRAAECRVPGCDRESISRRGLCHFHDERLLRTGTATRLTERELAAWIAREHPRLGAHQFSLAGLPELLEAELLYGLQQRDQTPPPLDPTLVRILVARLGDAASIRAADPQAVSRAGGVQYNSAVRGLFRDLHRYVNQARVRYSGTDPFDGDLWQVALLELPVNGSRRWSATLGTIDLRVIEPVWLREIVRNWARDTRPYLQRLRETLRACQAASHVLTTACPADLTRLGAGDFTRILDGISAQRRADGTLYSAKHRNLMIYQFCQVIEYGRSSGLMSEVPDPFRPAVRHRLREDPNEEELGKALPETVIRQLDARLDLLGPAGRGGTISAASLQLMHQTIYQILRDTGRRPGEVVSLRDGCIEVTGGQHNLIYDNHKAGRKRRRLPVTGGTAGIIAVWQQHRARLRVPPELNQWLFPTPLLRARQSRGHITPSCVARAFKAWTAKIGTIDSDLAGADGTPLPFDPSLITPYALRHSYAQRHADAGVPVDVLKELMDHAAISTTMGYYQVSLKRKQQAIASVSPLATDAAGNPAPFTSPAAYERASVAVPFGNCTEPSNVKAGGGACPIRFQCAGCGFYRPDPSYLPALEQHIASLRADIETARAMDAAEYVLASMSAEISAFQAVAQKMRASLSRLDPAQRDEVEEASRLLRRTRAARTLPLTDITGSTTQTA